MIPLSKIGSCWASCMCRGGIVASSSSHLARRSKTNLRCLTNNGDVFNFKKNIRLYQEKTLKQTAIHFSKKIQLQFNHLCQLCVSNNPKSSLLFLRCWDAPREIRCWSAEVEHICRESQVKKVPMKWQSFQAFGFLICIFFLAGHMSVKCLFFPFFSYESEGLVHPITLSTCATKFWCRFLFENIESYY